MINVYKNVPIMGINFTTGQFYNFQYTNYENDPDPMVLMLNYCKGVHPNTNHYHNYIQCLNFNYLSRTDRQLFLDLWVKIQKEGGSTDLTWQMCCRRWPYLKLVIRRYLVDHQMILNPKFIPPDKYQDEIKRSMFKDYSMIARRKIMAYAKSKISPKRSKKR